MQVQPYLCFEGRCDEALEFYRSAVNAEVLALMRFKEAPDPAMISPQSADKVMHASMRIGNSIVLASDGRCNGQTAFGGFSLTLTVPNDIEAERMFSALMQGGQTVMPLAETFFASKFGMLTDKFGVQWMVMVGQ